MIPLAPVRLRRLAREFRAADRALVARHQEGDELMYGPPPQAELARGVNRMMSAEEVTQGIRAGVAQPIRAPRTSTEIAWVKALLALAQESQSTGGRVTQMLIEEADRSGVDVLGSGIVGFNRYMAAFLVGEPLDAPGCQETSTESAES